jgi:thiol-disulfide isomerase/thioredoxin
MRLSWSASGLPSLGILLILLAGCNGEVSSGSGGARSQPVNAVDVTIQPVDEAGFDEVIGQFHGKVVVVDFWQTTCDTCRYEFPKLVKLHASRTGQPVVTVSMNLDDPRGKNVEERVRQFLQKHHADFTHLRLAAGQKPNEWIEKRLRLTDGLPGQRVYDRQGKLVRTFTGGDDYPDIEALVDRLLKQS